MSTLTDDVLDAVEFLIHRHHLHSRVPVDLSPILERFEICRHNFTPMTMGFTLVRPKLIHIGISKNLDAPWQRMALAHEAGHIIANQPHQLFVCKTGDWSRDKDEREAQLIAACLLVPVRIIEESYQVGAAPQLGKILKVPPSLVDLRWSFARVHGDI